MPPPCPRLPVPTVPARACAFPVAGDSPPRRHPHHATPCPRYQAGGTSLLQGCMGGAHTRPPIHFDGRLPRVVGGVGGQPEAADLPSPRHCGRAAGGGGRARQGAAGLHAAGLPKRRCGACGEGFERGGVRTMRAGELRGGPGSLRTQEPCNLPGLSGLLGARGHAWRLRLQTFSPGRASYASRSRMSPASWKLLRRGPRRRGATAPGAEEEAARTRLCWWWSTAATSRSAARCGSWSRGCAAACQTAAAAMSHRQPTHPLPPSPAALRCTRDVRGVGLGRPSKRHIVLARLPVPSARRQRLC